MGDLTNKINKVTVALVEARLAVFCREVWEAVRVGHPFFSKERSVLSVLSILFRSL